MDALANAPPVKALMISRILLPPLAVCLANSSELIPGRIIKEPSLYTATKMMVWMIRLFSSSIFQIFLKFFIRLFIGSLRYFQLLLHFFRLLLWQMQKMHEL